jgi:hypothetical protein
MSDLTHACSVFMAGLIQDGLGLALSWHCWRSLKLGSVQVSQSMVLERKIQPVGFRLMILFFGMSSLVLLGAGMYCISAAVRLF